MALISCDMRFGRTDEQKRRLATGLLRVVSAATGEAKDNIFFVIREGRNFVEHGEHLPEFVEGAANDKELIERLIELPEKLSCPSSNAISRSVLRKNDGNNSLGASSRSRTTQSGRIRKLLM
jgi:4-oxalocrotonate tautomerase